MSQQGWFPLALSRDIAPGTSAGTRVNGKEFVVWRDENGTAHVWEDRCPHRGMKMSFGFVRGDHIACLYHGWQYDTAGQCRYIPAHPDLDVPKTIRIPRFAVAEAGGIIWGCPDSEETDVPAPELPGAVTPLRTIFADCPASFLVERIAMTAFENATPKVTGAPGRIVNILLCDADLTAAVQPIADRESALHIVVAGAPEPVRMKQLSLWAEQLRRDAEEAASRETTTEIAA